MERGGGDKVRLAESKWWWERWHTIICLAQFTEDHAQVGSEAVSGTGLQTQVRGFFCLGGCSPLGGLAGGVRRIRKQALTLREKRNIRITTLPSHSKHLSDTDLPDAAQSRLDSL